MKLKRLGLLAICMLMGSLLSACGGQQAALSGAVPYAQTAQSKIMSHKTLCSGTGGMSITPCPIVMKCSRPSCDRYAFYITGGTICCYLHRGSCREICDLRGKGYAWGVTPGIKCGSVRLTFVQVNAKNRITGRVTQQITNKAPCGGTRREARSLNQFDGPAL